MVCADYHVITGEGTLSIPLVNPYLITVTLLQIQFLPRVIQEQSHSS